MDLTKIQQFSKERLAGDLTGHDYRHICRVIKNANDIMKDETLAQSQVDLIHAAIYVHDVIDDKVTTDPDKALQDVDQCLKDACVTEEEIHHIHDIITHMSYSRNLQSRYELTLEGQIVQDADRIDSLGAMGIARTFYYAGQAGHLLYDEERPRDLETLTTDNYRNQGTAINHFYEKLIHLHKTMNRPSAKRLAKERTEVIESFLDQFNHETYRS